MNNKRGQALVEFVIILPIFLLLLFAFIDYGRVIYAKNELSNLIPEVEKMYKNNSSINEIESILKKNNSDNKITIRSYDNETKIELYRYISITPISDTVLDNPYMVSTEIVIKNE